MSELEAANAKISAVRDLHKHAHRGVEEWARGYRFTGDHCSYDGEHWPCATIEAMDQP